MDTVTTQTLESFASVVNQDIASITRFNTPALQLLQNYEA
jgi:hypothetical protein